MFPVDELLKRELAVMEAELARFDADFPEQLPSSALGSILTSSDLKKTRLTTYAQFRRMVKYALQRLLQQETAKRAETELKRIEQSSLEWPSKASLTSLYYLFTNIADNDWMFQHDQEGNYTLAAAYGAFFSPTTPVSQQTPAPYHYAAPGSPEELASEQAKAKFVIPLLTLDKKRVHLEWYIRSLHFDSQAKIRDERLLEHLKNCHTWPRRPLSQELADCQRALELVKQQTPLIKLTGFTGEVLCQRLPPAEEIRLLESVAGELGQMLPKAPESTAPATPTAQRLPALPLMNTYRLLPSIEDSCNLSNTLQALGRLTSIPLTYSLVGDGTSDSVYVALTAPAFLLPKIEEQLQSFHPNLELEELPADELPTDFTAAADYCITNPWGLLRSVNNFTNADPLAPFCTNLQGLKKSELAILQIVFALVKEENLPRALWQHRHQLSEHDQKIKNQPPTWAVRIKILVTALDTTRAADILHDLEQHLQQFNQHPYQLVRWTPSQEENFLTVALCCRPPDPKWVSVLRDYCSRFSPLLWPTSYLKTDELAALVHLPHKSIPSTWLMRPNNRQKPIPEFLTTKSGLYLGTAEYRKQQHQIRLPFNRRTSHAYIVGASGSGKSNLLKNCIRQDIEAGRGLCVIDPHGDLVTDVLPFIPENRLADVIIFNPADRDFPVSINPFGVTTTDDDRNSTALTFQTVFMRMFGVGDEAPRMLHLLHMVTAALLEAGNKTFLDIRRFLINGDFREEVLNTVNDPTVLEFWFEEYPRDYPKAAAAPINTRLTQFSMSPITRNILGQKHQAFNIYDVMNSGKILLCPLGIIEEQERQLLGSLLVSQLQLATMRRAEIPEAERRPFIAYIDEFQNFANDVKSLEKILSEARKYGLGLVLAHQYTTQISSKLADAIMANTFTKIIFRVGSEDARYLQKALTDFTPEDLQNQNTGQAVLCAGRAQDSFTIKTEKFPDPPQAHYGEAVTEHSRRTYGRPRAEVEAELRPKRPAPAAQPEPTTAPESSQSPQAANVFDELMGDP